MHHLWLVKMLILKLSKKLGHVNIQETNNTYNHLTMRDKEKATDFFDSIL